MTRRDTETCETSKELGKSPPDYRAPALDKGLDIIEFLAFSGKPTALGTISGRLNKSVNQLFRMIRVLERRGYIALTEGHTGYELTDKLLSLGMAHGASKKLLDYNLPAMRRVRELEKENAKLRRIVADLLLDNAAIPDFKSGTR